MDLVDKKGISQIERTGLGFLFWGAIRSQITTPRGDGLFLLVLEGTLI
jgi:hypothetical protein